MVKEIFLGRSLQRELIEKRIIDLKNGYRQNIAIIGDELVGKTSLIFNFIRNFSDPHILPLYLEVRPEPFKDFKRRFMGVLLYAFLDNSSISLQENLDFLIEKSRNFIPKTADKITDLLRNPVSKKKADNFFELLEVCDLIYQESGKRCVVIWDEFHNLEYMGIKTLYAEWSKALITHKNTMFVR